MLFVLIPNGECVMGEVDRDADSDGLIDIACPGGEDCDDENPNCARDCTDRAPQACHTPSAGSIWAPHGGVSASPRASGTSNPAVRRARAA